MMEAGSWIVWMALGAAVLLSTSQGFATQGGAKFERPGAFSAFF